MFKGLTTMVYAPFIQNLLQLFKIGLFNSDALKNCVELGAFHLVQFR